MDQEYDLAFDEPKKMTVYIFDTNEKFIKSIIVNEYIFDIAFDAKNKSLYGLSAIEGKIYAYDLSDVL